MVNENDKTQFRLALAAMAEAFGKECPVTLQKTYWLVLSDLTIDQFKAACVTAMRTLKWFPKPAELLELANGSIDDQAEKAWLEADREVQRVGYRGTPNITNQATIMAIRSCGGWVQFCQSPIKDDQWLKKRFVEAWKTFAKHPQPEPRRLVGEIEAVRGIGTRPRGLAEVGQSVGLIVGPQANASGDEKGNATMEAGRQENAAGSKPDALAGVPPCRFSPEGGSGRAFA